MTEKASPSGTSGGEEVRVDRKLIREGFLEWETEEPESTAQRIQEAVVKYGAFIADDNVSRSSSRISHTVVVRVPEQNFDSLLAAVGEGVEKFDSRRINVQDVTEEYVDVEARLKTKKELEGRYLELLKQAKTVTEMLEIEREIGNLRAEIESIEGRLNYLKDRISLSTLHLTFYQQFEHADGDSWADRFGEGFGNGWRNMVWFLVGLVNLWPFLLLILGGIFLVRRLLRRKKA